MYQDEGTPWYGVWGTPAKSEAMGGLGAAAAIGEALPWSGGSHLRCSAWRSSNICKGSYETKSARPEGCGTFSWQYSQGRTFLSLLSLLSPTTHLTLESKKQQLLSEGEGEEVREREKKQTTYYSWRQVAHLQPDFTGEQWGRSYLWKKSEGLFNIGCNIVFSGWGVNVTNKRLETYGSYWLLIQWQW